MDIVYTVFIIDALISVVIFLSSVYIYLKVSVIPVNKRYLQVATLTLGSIGIAILYALLRNVNTTFASVVSYFFPSVFFILFEREKRRLKFLAAFLSSSFTRIVSLFPVMLLSIITASIGMSVYVDNVIFNKILLLFAYLVCFGIIIILLKLKRLNKGLQFFQDEKNLGLGLTISGVLFSLFSVIYTQDIKNYLFALLIILGLFTSAFGLYLWIRRSITAHYRERLQLKSEEHYQALLSEKEQEIEKLNQSNEYLAKVVHRDNHLMSSLNSSIDAYFESNDTQFRDDLLRDIQTLAKERGELIAKEQREAKILPSTGNPLIDGAINDLYTKAAAHGIDFSLTVAAPVGEVIGKFISQTDLQTLICDHIKDAVIAVEATGEGKGKILVEFAMNNGSYSVTVFDSGIAFEPETLAKLGKERVTTHADNGGSGIGFMTTFETLRKAHAGLKITEFETKTPFTKSVSFRFNGENTFTIQSYRSDMLREVLQREDIVIL